MKTDDYRPAPGQGRRHHRAHAANRAPPSSAPPAQASAPRANAPAVEEAFETFSDTEKRRQYDVSRGIDVDPEAAELRLRYRNRKVFAVGHGMSADWELDEQGKCVRINLDPVLAHDLRAHTDVLITQRSAIWLRVCPMLWKTRFLNERRR